MRACHRTTAARLYMPANRRAQQIPAEMARMSHPRLKAISGSRRGMLHLDVQRRRGGKKRTWLRRVCKRPCWSTSQDRKPLTILHRDTSTANLRTIFTTAHGMTGRYSFLCDFVDAQAGELLVSMCRIVRHHSCRVRRCLFYAHVSVRVKNRTFLGLPAFSQQ